MQKIICTGLVQKSEKCTLVPTKHMDRDLEN